MNSAFVIFGRGCATVEKCLEQGETWAAITKIAVPIIIALVVLYVIYVAACWFVFKKAKYEPWKALIPVYNWFIMFQIIGYNKWLSLLMLVPVVNIGFYVWMCLGLAKAFSQKEGFAIGLMVLNPVFMWFLAMGKQYEYAYAKGKQIPFADAFKSPTAQPEQPAKPEQPAQQPAQPAPESTQPAPVPPQNSSQPQ